tara:strand:- start:262 stop:531 length:270 start_codon:yes stop_codon:yes gene_type:complete
MKTWRTGARTSLFARPIYNEDMPILIKAMIDDNLVGTIGDRGVVWQNNGYSITPKAVRDAWSLTATQYKRVCDYIYENNPFLGEDFPLL